MADLPTILAVGGDTVVRAVGATVCIARRTTDLVREIARFDVDLPVAWLEVAPDGSSVLVGGARGLRAWQWRDGAGHRLLADAKGGREAFGMGFVALGGEMLTLLAQSRHLRGIGVDGQERFAADIEVPRSFYPSSFTALPGRQLAMVGHEFGDGLDSVVTVSLDALACTADAVQIALQERRPIHDRAVRVAVGPCSPNAAVAYRDPEDEEVPDDEEDFESMSDVGNFKGVYVRDLDSGRLIERIPYAGQKESGVRMVGTPRLLMLEVAGGIDVIERGSGQVREFRAPATALDVPGMRAAWLDEEGHVEIGPVDKLL